MSKVAPERTCTVLLAVLPNAVPPLTFSTPPATVTVPTKLLLPVRINVPEPAFVKSWVPAMRELIVSGAELYCSTNSSRVPE